MWTTPLVFIKFVHWEQRAREVGNSRTYLQRKWRTVAAGCSCPPGDELRWSVPASAARHLYTAPRTVRKQTRTVDGNGQSQFTHTNLSSSCSHTFSSHFRTELWSVTQFTCRDMLGSVIILQIPEKRCELWNALHVWLFRRDSIPANGLLQSVRVRPSVCGLTHEFAMVTCHNQRPDSGENTRIVTLCLNFPISF
jgi:hypothetical protein